MMGSFKVTPDHLLFLLLLTPLWCLSVRGSTSTPDTEETGTQQPRSPTPPPTPPTTTTPPPTTTTTPTTPTPTTTKPPPQNVQRVTVVTQNENSITLNWERVDSIPTYLLKYVQNGENVEKEINAGAETTIGYTVSSLTPGTKYNFALFTVDGGVQSSGHLFSAVTAPRNTQQFKSVDQNETSINLQWAEVENILSYQLKYSGGEINVTGTSHTISGLTAATKHNITLFSVFEGVKSSGETITAVTAPERVEKVTVETQNESSITLKWMKVGSIPKYILQYDEGGADIIETDEGTVVYPVLGLSAGTKYNFTLFTVFEKVNSTGYKFEAVTAPRNTQQFKSVDQNETSINLQWAEVENILSYQLKYSGGEINVTGTSHTISGLTAATKHNITLFSVFEGVKSSGETITAVTAPERVKEVTVVTQNESSITLRWMKVGSIPMYILQYKDNTKDIIIPDGETEMDYVVSPLTAGTKYNFTIFTIFENVTSSGENFLAVTAPERVEKVTVETQNESSITLKWMKVGSIPKYILQYDEGGADIIETDEGTVVYPVLGLSAGTKYNFTLFTVFEKVNSTGYKFEAVTAPRNTQQFKSVDQNETSINLQWAEVENILSYQLKYSGGEINVTGTSHTISGLTAATKHNITLFSVFEGVKSSGETITAVTAPRKVAYVTVVRHNESSISLKWDKAGGVSTYILESEDGSVTKQISALGEEATVEYTVSPLPAGTRYNFTIIAVFEYARSQGLNIVAVTALSATNCANASWHITSSSIQAVIQGVFSNATANNVSVIPYAVREGSNVSFSGLSPGSTYEVVLFYQAASARHVQCCHNVTIRPQDLKAHCAYWAGGYSMLVKWNKPDGVWTIVEVTVSGKTTNVSGSEALQVIISGFQPAKTYDVSVMSLSGTVRSENSDRFTCTTDPRGVIAGAVIAVLLFLLLLGLALLVWRKRPDIIRKQTFISHSKRSNQTEKAIPVAKFPDHFHYLSVDQNRGFSQEYESLIPSGTEQTQKAASNPENKVKNRFVNVHPYDWCRVKLKGQNNDIDDYINANYMPGYSRSREFIAAQGPLPTTVDDFWRMAWEQSVTGIIMVTNCLENGRTKCEQYWPEHQGKKLYGDLQVTIRSEQQEPNWTLREFSVKYRQTSEERTIKHFHFTAWPDHGVPACTDVLIRFRRLVRWHIESGGAQTPTMVHCSAGVGRTGTIIALDVLLQQLEKEGRVGIHAFVHKMRLSRPHMVQTESQYVFLHQCIMDSLLANEKHEENIYENSDMIYANATALREFHSRN
ncbi:receptor-type tyrosine-protein phosphatase H-like isoform X2 [Genypterus blacodes]|uniref:receptor-type tyrosine-protein phosphatase H-like isoform X2 n=1 Tax=Genypterus blacodes TaxID=154954 RepID=UPI003F758856